MLVRQAIDEFLSYMQVERNVSVNTIRSYAYDLHVFEAFLQKVHGITELQYEAVRIYGKGNKERVLPLHLMVLPLIQEYREQLKAPQLHPKEPVFTNYLGESLDPRGLHRIFKEVLQHAGLPPHRFTLHHLRHTFATLLLRSHDATSKVDIRTLQELLGHESLATTSIYTHVDLEQKKQAIDSLRFDL